jgi:glycosyltransferase involved in cell wall biosynthesis
MKGFSIIICTYNPTKEILERLLNAILKLESSSCDYEVIIVDNNSSPVLERFEYVKYFLKSCQLSKIIVEKKSGLTSARIAGIKAAKFDWLIFFDDDNEPAPDYLKHASKAVDEVNTVGVWGPGQIDVIYVDGSSKWLETKKDLYQQRNHESTIYGYEKGSQDYYPDGTGMVLLKSIALEYVAKIENSIYTLSDRKMKLLSSGGDLQIVLTATKLGYGAGRFKYLKLKHNIDKRKTTLKYMAKLGFGLEACNYAAHYEVLEWGQSEVNTFDYAKTNIILKYIYNRLFIQKQSFKNFILEFSRFAGQQIGVAVLKKEKHPSRLINFASFIINR